jgi:hypothetical protein
MPSHVTACRSVFLGAGSELRTCRADRPLTDCVTWCICTDICITRQSRRQLSDSAHVSMDPV